MARSIKNVVKDLYFELDSLANEYEELTDTEVREALHFALNYFFVWGKEGDRLPMSYGMFDKSGDEAVAKAVRRFLVSAKASSELKELAVGKNRLGALQDPSVITPAGRQYDEFIGHREEPLVPTLPPWMNEPGDYDDP